MHDEAFTFVREAVDAYNARGPVYEIGSRNVNGTVREIFKAMDPNVAYHGIDVVAGEDVDVVANGATYTPPVPPQTVICCEVLEHAPEAAAIVARACAVLQPGGLLLLTMAGPGRDPHSGTDGGLLLEGEFYRNIDLGDAVSWIALAGLHPLAIMFSTDGSQRDLYVAARKRSDGE